MKQSPDNADLEITNVQIQLDNTVLQNNAFLSRQNEPLNLREFISLLQSSLIRDEILYIQKQLNFEVDATISRVCAMFPNDVWKPIFGSLCNGNDMEICLTLKQVCKRWDECVSESVDEVSIRKKYSLNGIPSLRSLRTLVINCPLRLTEKIFEDSFSRLHTLIITHSKVKRPNVHEDKWAKMWLGMTNLKCLDFSKAKLPYNDQFIISPKNISLLTNLETLKIGRGGMNFISSDIEPLIHLKNLDITNDRPLTSSEFQSQFGGNNFRLIEHLKELECFNLPRFYFLSEYKIQEKYSHIRFRWFFSQVEDTYSYYEGKFSENDDFHGDGIVVYYNGDRYEGIFKDGEATEGKHYSSDGSRYEGGYKNGSRDEGVYYYSNGDIYEGQFVNDAFEGKGKYYYSNGNRYEGEFKEWERVNNGIFYYSNGEKYEGNSKDFTIEDGILKILK